MSIRTGNLSSVMNKVLVSLTLLIPILSFAQPSADDEVVFQSAVDWLNRKLNYIYHDGAADKWWVNKFYVNENKYVTIKNTLTANPRSVSIHEKTFHTRTFQIEDINPYQISITDIERNQGRIVKGKLMELKTVDLKKSIHHTINDRTGTDVSFVQISFPTFMTDSIADYAETVQAKLKEAIIAATKVYASGSLEENKRKMFEVMEGSFTNDDEDELETVRKFENVLSLSSNDSENYFVYTPSDQLFYLTSISNQGVVSKKYRLISDEKIILQNIENETETIAMETANSFAFNGKLYYKK